MWEPQRIAPSYAVPRQDVTATLEADQPLVGHPRDPMHRIDVCPSSRRIRVEDRGTVLAESDEAMLLFEGTLPLPRYYLPRHAIRVPLAPGRRHTTCAYKGHAAHWTVETGRRRLTDIARSHEQPEHDAERVRGYISLYTERLDVFADGKPVERVHAPWSEPAWPPAGRGTAGVAAVPAAWPERARPASTLGP